MLPAFIRLKKSYGLHGELISGSQAQVIMLIDESAKLKGKINMLCI